MEKQLLISTILAHKIIIYQNEIMGTVSLSQATSATAIWLNFQVEAIKTFVNLSTDSNLFYAESNNKMGIGDSKIGHVDGQRGGIFFKKTIWRQHGGDSTFSKELTRTQNDI